MEGNGDSVNEENVSRSEVDDSSITESSPDVLSQPSMSQNSSSIVSFRNIQGVMATESKCFVCGSLTGRKAVPWPAIQQVWFAKNCYIPKSNRTCAEHLNGSKKFNDEALEMIEAWKQGIEVKSDDFELWIHQISDIPKSTPYSFENDGIEAEKYKIFLGISKESFDDLIQYLAGMI